MTRLERAARIARRALLRELDELNSGVLDWGDPNDLNDPSTEYARAWSCANGIGRALRALESAGIGARAKP